MPDDEWPSVKRMLCRARSSKRGVGIFESGFCIDRSP